jgi:hypothetical protein
VLPVTGTCLLLDGVLGGHHEEEIRQFVRLSSDGNLAFLHCFEKRCLDFGGGAIDFVRQNQVAKDGTGLEFELTLTVGGVVDLRSRDVAGEEIGGELDAGEMSVHALCKAFDCAGFREAGKPL